MDVLVFLDDYVYKENIESLLTYVKIDKTNLSIMKEYIKEHALDEANKIIKNEHFRDIDNWSTVELFKFIDEYASLNDKIEELGIVLREAYINAGEDTANNEALETFIHALESSGLKFNKNDLYSGKLMLTYEIELIPRNLELIYKIMANGEDDETINKFDIFDDNFVNTPVEINVSIPYNGWSTSPSNDNINAILSDRLSEIT